MKTFNSNRLMTSQMPFFRCVRCCRLGWLAGALIGTWTSVHAQSTNAVPAAVALPKSVFIDDSKVGRDPFFPLSTRRNPKVPAAVVTSTETPSLAPGLKSLDQIKLRGITRTASRRFALINNRSFEAGEQGDLKTTEGKLRIKCVEIRDRSVIIVIIGETQERELHLNEKL